MLKKNKPDYFLLAAIVILIVWGFFTLATVSFPYSLEKYGNAWHYVKHQLFYGLLPGIVLAIIAFRAPIEFIKKISLPVFIINFILLVLLFIPGLGAEINGARRWLNINGTIFQPSEFIKLSFLVYISTWLASRYKSKTLKEKTEKQTVIVFATIIIILAAMLIWQKDLSTLIIIFIIGLLIYFASWAPRRNLLFLFLIISLAVGLLIKLEPYRLNRVLTALNPQADPLGKGYQLKQSMISIGSGRIWGIGEFFGSGLGLSNQKFGFLPQPMTDSIFAIIGEETGFIGASLLIILFGLIFWRGIVALLRSQDEFSRLLILGITCWLVLQTFFNIAGITGIMPLAGIPLPFFSYGSSHLIIEMIGVGLLLNISKHH